VHGRPPLPPLEPPLCLPVGGGNNEFGPLGIGESSIISSSSLSSGEVPLEEDDMEAEAEAEGMDGHLVACGSSTGVVHGGYLCTDEVGVFEGGNAFWGTTPGQWAAERWYKLLVSWACRTREHGSAGVLG